MKIEVLHFDDCPNHEPAVKLVQEVLREEGISAEVSEVNVSNAAAAQALDFIGSPSIRINGLDVEPDARTSKEFGMMCRTYLDAGKRVRMPSRELIRSALRGAAQDQAAQAQPAHDCCRASTAPPVQSAEPTAPQRKWLMGASVAAAVGASLCCILPIVTAVTGVGVLATGAAFERWRPYLLGVTGLLLGVGFLFLYRDHKRACAPGSLCVTRPVTRLSLIALCAVAALAAGVAAFPYYSGAVAQVLVGKPASSGPVGSGALAMVTFRIPDMDCPACAVSLSATFRRLPGVADAKLDVDGRKAVVTYDPAAQNVAALEKVISGAGFHIASSEPRS